ncbi:MAG: hypothetical protein DI527_23800 [Chelatococcus sp.]|nr:MAG: hypothetical protein DI527_23800 [Chelatococcus sp.]
MIEKSVGRAGVNGRNDTLIVQCLLNVARARTGVKPIAIDGLVGPETIGAITAFQQRSPGLAHDGRIDPDGRTLTTLIAFIGGDEYVFGPIVQQLLAIKTEIDRLAIVAPPPIKRPLLHLSPGLVEVSKYKDIAAGAPASGPLPVMALNAGAPKFGFVGADDAMAATALLAMAFVLSVLIILMIQNPTFRKAVSVRAKELDRILRALQVSSMTGLRESVDIINSIFSDSKDEEQRCRQSPTFQETPECTAAMRRFAETLKKMQSLLPRLMKALQEVLDFAKRPHAGFDIMKLRLAFNKIVKDAQALSFDLQVDLADMREKCKCPEGP